MYVTQMLIRTIFECTHTLYLGIDCLRFATNICNVHEYFHIRTVGTQFIGLEHMAHTITSVVDAYKLHSVHRLYNITSIDIHKRHDTSNVQNIPKGLYQYLCKKIFVYLQNLYT